MGATHSNDRLLTIDRHTQPIITSNVDPLTQRVLPAVNPLAEVPRRVQTGQVTSVKFNVSTDPRGDVDHLVGASMPSSSADPRAFGALRDRQNLATMFDNDRVYHIPEDNTFK